MTIVVYMAFQPARFTPEFITKPRRGLLHHVFTLTHLFRLAVCFLWHLLYPTVVESHPLDGAALCVVRTFLIFSARGAYKKPRQNNLQYFPVNDAQSFFVS